jgi:hypothetical protein
VCRAIPIPPTPFSISIPMCVVLSISPVSVRLCSVQMKAERKKKGKEAQQEVKKEKKEEKKGQEGDGQEGDGEEDGEELNRPNGLLNRPKRKRAVRY